MTDRNELDITKVAERFDSGERMAVDQVETGQWYWVKSKATYDWGDYKKGDTYEWFGCVMDIGSNYVQIESPHSRNGHNGKRVHFDEFDDVLRFEPNPEAVIEKNKGEYVQKIAALNGEISELTALLGVVPTKMVAEKLQEGTNALVVVSGQVDVSSYKVALIEAKQKTLPALFKAMEEAHVELARWMSAPIMGMKAQMESWKGSQNLLEDRIHTLELYAGLTEDAVAVREGDPAAREEKLRVMQRRYYMDEECLVAYEAGGMDIRDITGFDKWLSRPENFQRILPFPRCAVAFRVRRENKEREAATLMQAFINVQLNDMDKTTFLYVRNGDQIWRVNCDFDFGEKIVPDMNEFDPSQPMMMKRFANRIDKIIPLSAWEVMREKSEEVARKCEEQAAQEAANPGGKYPHIYDAYSEWREYEPFNHSSVHYDEGLAEISKRIKEYNRVAVIIQGLFDRSMVLHPHNPVQVWQQDSFAASIELIYDATTLTYGDKPDFEAYRKRLNRRITDKSVVVGQEDYWMRAEADKENRRQENDYRSSHRFHYTRYSPHGNPGPGFVAQMAEWKPRSAKAVFRWERERQRERYLGTVACTITVPASELLNVSAYKPGDFKQFFDDPRTRREYLQWAPLMLAAEDYHAGKTTLGNTQRNAYE
jgi:hypothetical protein